MMVVTANGGKYDNNDNANDDDNHLNGNYDDNDNSNYNVDYNYSADDVNDNDYGKW